MRATVAILLMGLAFWAAVVDWNATIGTGYAYRFGTFGDRVGGWWPEGTARVVSGLRDSGIAWAWDPVGALVLSLAVAPLLAAVAVGVWITRERPRMRARW